MTVPRLATCSYAEFTPSMGHPVQISLSRPKFPIQYALRDSVWAFTPRYRYFTAPDDLFDRELLAQLDRYGVDRLVRELQEIAAGADVQPLVMLCFEDVSRKSCHRTLVAQWWAQQTGQQVPELGAQPQPTLW